MAAIISPLFKVQEYQLEEYNPYPIKISWQFFKNSNNPGNQMEIEEEKKESEIFK